VIVEKMTPEQFRNLLDYLDKALTEEASYRIGNNISDHRGDKRDDEIYDHVSKNFISSVSNQGVSKEDDTYVKTSMSADYDWVLKDGTWERAPTFRAPLDKPRAERLLDQLNSHWKNATECQDRIYALRKERILSEEDNAQIKIALRSAQEGMQQAQRAIVETRSTLNEKPDFYVTIEDLEKTVFRIKELGSLLSELEAVVRDRPHIAERELDALDEIYKVDSDPTDGSW
jgi:hypothetical protein